MTPNDVQFNRFMTLDRLLRGDRIIWQKPDDGMLTNAVWWDQQPQLGGPKLWLTTASWLLKSELIVKTDLVPATSHCGRDWKHASLYVATPAAIDAFLAMNTPQLPARAR